MTPTSEMNLAVVVEKRPPLNSWGEVAWRPVAVLPHAGGEERWREVESVGGRARYRAGPVTLALRRTAVSQYRENLIATRPAVFVVLAPAPGEVPWRVARVTVDPFDAEQHMAGGANLVEALPMPAEIYRWLGAFTDAHYVEQPFKKRQRDTARALEQPVFGKEPIFQRRPQDAQGEE